MAFEWRDFLALAERLAATEGEAELRSCVSRAYFAAYGVALRYGEQIGYQRSGNPDDHGGLRGFFQNRRHVRLGQRLHTLRENRNLCDYSDAVVNLGDMAEASLGLARHIFEHCNQPTSEPDK